MENLSSGKKGSYIQSGAHHKDYLCAVLHEKPCLVKKIILKPTNFDQEADQEESLKMLNGALLEIFRYDEKLPELLEYDDEKLSEMDHRFEEFAVIEAKNLEEDIVFEVDQKILAARVRNAGKLPMFSKLSIGKLCF